MSIHSLRSVGNDFIGSTLHALMYIPFVGTYICMCADFEFLPQRLLQRMLTDWVNLCSASSNNLNFVDVFTAKQQINIDDTIRVKRFGKNVDYNDWLI